MSLANPNTRLLPERTDWLGWCAWGAWALLLVAVSVLVLIKPTSPSLNVLWRDTGRNWTQGAELYDAAGFRYSPLIAALLSGLASLPLGAGAVLVRLGNAAGLLAALSWWLAHAAPARLGPRARAAFLILLAVLSLPNLHTGQFNPLVIGLLLGSVTAVQAERWNLAAAFLALAGVLKVYPLAFALLLVVVYPRQLCVRLPIAVLAVLALPFLTQHPSYVLEQYQHWLHLLVANDAHRRFMPLTVGETYRDLFYLFRLYNIPISVTLYTALQALTGLACALACWTAARAGLPARDVLWRVLLLGTCWLTLCGPATEPRTYLLVVPALAWWAVWTYQHGPTLAGWLVAQACGLQLLGVLSSVSPHSVLFFRSAGLHPLSGLFLLASYLAAQVATQRAGAIGVSVADNLEDAPKRNAAA